MRHVGDQNGSQSVPKSIKQKDEKLHIFLRLLGHTFVPPQGAFWTAKRPLFGCQHEVEITLNLNMYKNKET